MEAFIRFWNFLLRLFLGLIFVILCVVLADDRNLINMFIESIKKIDFKIINSLTPSILIIFFIAIIGALGLFLLETITTAIGSFVYILFKKIIGKVFFKKEVIALLFVPIPELAKRYFKNHCKSINEYYSLKCWAQPESKGKMNTLKKQIEGIEKHIDGLSEIRYIEYADYYSSVTQEQVKRDQLRDEIREVYYLQIIVMMISILLVKYTYMNYLWMLLIIALMCTTIFVIIEKRRRFAIYTILGYLDIFSLGKSAIVEDRDAI